jgi:hypothetical protein
MTGWEQASDPEIRGLAGKHPGWVAWRSVSGLLHAKLVADDSVQVRGEDAVDLADQIRRAEALQLGADALRRLAE